MNDKWTKVNPVELPENVFRVIGKQWMLITTGKLERWNTMTASWGALGVLWNLPVATVYVRPERHTFGFIEELNGFTLNFLPEKHRSVLNLMGSRSGKDFDKMRESGLTAFESPEGGVAFEECDFWMDCRKLYWQDLDPEHFLDERISACYEKGGIHRMFVADIRGLYLNSKTI